MNKTRKPLDKSIANEFVFGKEIQQNTEDNDLVSSTTLHTLNEVLPVASKTVMQKITEIPTQKEAMIRFTVDLPESLHTKLSILAAKTKRKKSEIVRILISDALENLD